tara:strand:- start:7457 stop:8158 length:702 start_codon:yes stop_codon:yes gene_type:complete
MSFEQAIPFKEQFLEHDHGWRPNTKEIYRKSLNRYIKSGFPDSNYRALVIRCLNRLSNWCFKEGLTSSHTPMEGGSKFTCKTRVFNDDELKKILNEITPIHFQEMVRFIYYTGARQCEVRDFDFEDYGHYIKAKSKGADRLIRMNSQAQEVLQRSKKDKWKYTACTASRAMRDSMKRLGIKGTLHDLRRTFGLRMIKKIGIYETSKLLGHASVSTTEKHYAPLLAIDIDDFTL